MKPGSKARVRVMPPSGVIADKRYNAEHDCLEYCLAYTDEQGEPQHRWFLESQLEPVEE